MPLYDIKCTECEHTYEDMIKLEDFDKEIKCPKCGKLAKRLTTATPPPAVSWKHWRL